MPFSRLFSVATVFALLLNATEAFSDENLLFFSQDSDLSGAMRNSLFAVQPLANGSRINRFLNSDIPVIQSGGNNQTEITVTKHNGQVRFNQTNLGEGVNNANINIGGPLAAGIVVQDGFWNEGSLIVNGEMANGALFQEGNRNHGNIDVSGVGASGIVTQKGDNNNTSLIMKGEMANAALFQEGSRNHGNIDVSGVGASGIVTQKGDNNNTSLKVSGNGTNVILLQEGDNISSSLAVKSGGRTVTIKQTSP